MNAVIVSEEPCYPATAGNRIRALNLMLHMAKRHRITYICRHSGTPAEAEKVRSFLGDHGICTIVVAHPVAAKKGPLFYLRLAGNLLSPLPYSVWMHNSPRVHQAMREHAAQNPVDLWQLEWLPYVSVARSLAGGRTVAIAHNVDALIWQRYHEIETSALKRFYIRQQWRKFQRFEQRLFHEADRVVAVTPDDAGLIRKHYGVETVHVVENGVDNAHFQATPELRDTNQILYLGALDYRPNQDALRVMLDELLPALRLRQPLARLAIVGRNPPAWLVQRAAGMDGVQLHANVPDVRPFLARCGVMAVPLRVGGGSRLKILEALAAGTPVVSTRVGAEGLNLTPGKDLVVVERAEEMGPALCRALEDPATLTEMARHGQQVVRACYDWSVLADKLEQVWETCVRGRTHPCSRSEVCPASSYTGRGMV